MKRLPLQKQQEEQDGWLQEFVEQWKQLWWFIGNEQTRQEHQHQGGDNRLNEYNPHRHTPDTTAATTHPGKHYARQTRRHDRRQGDKVSTTRPNMKYSKIIHPPTNKRSMISTNQKTNPNPHSVCSIGFASTDNTKACCRIEQIQDLLKRSTSDSQTILFQEIAQLCVMVFFDSASDLHFRPPSSTFSSGTNNPRSSQSKICCHQNNNNKQQKLQDCLSYLERLQTKDLIHRRQYGSHCNEMYIAYQVLGQQDNNNKNSNIGKSETLSNYSNDTNYSCFTASSNVSEATTRSRHHDPTITTTTTTTTTTTPYCPVYTAPHRYHRGTILGFVDITLRPYCHNNNVDSTSNNSATTIIKPNYSPFVTNLAVHPKARNLGIGSKLLNCCEHVVASNPTQWIALDNDDNDNHNMTILESNRCRKQNEAVVLKLVVEVNEDNKSALEFYCRRGYHLVAKESKQKLILLLDSDCTTTITAKRQPLEQQESATRICTNNRGVTTTATATKSSSSPSTSVLPPIPDGLQHVPCTKLILVKDIPTNHVPLDK